MNIVETEAHP